MEGELLGAAWEVSCLDELFTASGSLKTLRG